MIGIDRDNNFNIKDKVDNLSYFWKKGNNIICNDIIK